MYRRAYILVFCEDLAVRKGDICEFFILGVAEEEAVCCLRAEAEECSERFAFFPFHVGVVPLKDFTCGGS